MNAVCNVSWLGQADYLETSKQMLTYTDNRDDGSPDAIWLLEHQPVFTQGTSCQTVPEYNPDAIPVVKSNRGGQITYHGPGQLIAYLLFDIKRLGLGPRRLVQTIEQSIIDLLAEYGLSAGRREGAPGVYVNGAKIAALGLRIRNGKCFHGLSVNVDMNMQPFGLIEPCGIENLEVTQLRDLGVGLSMRAVATDLLTQMQKRFSWTNQLQLPDA